MANKSIKRFLNGMDFRIGVLEKAESYRNLVGGILNRYQWSKAENRAEGDEFKENKLGKSPTNCDSPISKYSSSEDDLSNNNKWKPEVAWLAKALEPALQFYKWALPTGNGIGDKPPPTNRSIAEIFASIQRSKLGIQDWSLSDLTIGLYLIYLQQASTRPVEDLKGEIITSESIVQDLIYHIELAKGCYRDNATGLARNSMLRGSNVLKFIKNSSVLRPGYYIGIDMRKKLVILGIRGTHTVYDVITDIVSSSHEEVTFEGYSTHFGTAEAARWFLTHEIETIRKCLDKHKGFRLRLVGHSLGGATASLLAMMLRKKSFNELGFSPDIISAVGYATPPCVSKELAESCSDFVTTVVMQDDIIPRLSVASLMRLRNEILQTDWVSVFEKEDWKGVVDLVTNARQVVSSVQDVARKLAEYAKFRGQAKHSEMPVKGVVNVVQSIPSNF
ncbi:alpha/beta-Hydrolases superfamily protein [Abeliophyllum distichum]|uniref:Alpha/beta-Hydrolases superfamily protein n=1 Tax=Abeliophyllum distichum TaxID=126358 RepID=A0ABD1RBX3_9LAMI